MCKDRRHIFPTQNIAYAISSDNVCRVCVLSEVKGIKRFFRSLLGTELHLHWNIFKTPF